MGIDIHFESENTGKHQYIAEVTEDYEGDKFHVVVFHKPPNKQLPHTHHDTKGFNTIQEVYDYIKNLQEQS